MKELKYLSNLELNELCGLLLSIEKLCKKDYSHVPLTHGINRIIQIVDSEYQKADNILTDRVNT